MFRFHFSSLSSIYRRQIDVFVDGSCLRNGSINSMGGIGIWFGPNDQRNARENIGISTNNRAEFLAAIRAIEIVVDEHKSMNIPRDVIDLIIHTDSRNTVMTMTRWLDAWIQSNWKKPVKNKDLICRLRELENSARQEEIFIQWKWIKGHANNDGNEGAHRLAISAAEMQT
jgi:ribonuclease HI